MTFPFYRGDGSGEGKRPDPQPELHQSPLAKLTNPESYRADPGLRDACNVALLLRQPLLLTGEPGTGKTQFAYSLAWELHLGEPLKFETKSTSTARDLFYTYDALRRFQDSQSGIRAGALSYISFQALGKAILRTWEREELPEELRFEHTDPCRSVVLIDEIDKAPRDFPNDILNELEHMYFRVPELGNAEIPIGPDHPDLRPIIVLTSNSEKDLPDAFLRRCIYYHIEFPDRNRLEEIVTSHLAIAADSAFLRDALQLFELLREPRVLLGKRPATAELLNWLVALRKKAGDAVPNPMVDQELVKSTLSPLIKTAEDQKGATGIVEQWWQARQSTE